jgi:hypothetical protein
MKMALIAILMMVAAGCTDATRAEFHAYGDPAHVVCWSGGTLVYDGWSTGKVGRAAEGADGYRFKDAKTGAFKEVSGDCNVTYGADKGGN